MAKITEEIYADIEKRIINGEKLQSIANSYNISLGHIKRFSTKIKRVKPKLSELTLQCDIERNIEHTVDNLSAILPKTRWGLIKAVRDITSLQNKIHIPDDTTMDDNDIMKKVMIYEKIADTLEKWITKVGGLKLTIEAVQEIKKNEPKFSITPVRMIENEHPNT